MENLTIFVDNVGRMILGRVNKKQKTGTGQFAIDNPAIVNIQADQQTGNISVQLLPYLFTEFVNEEVRNKLTWTFNKSQVTECTNLKLDERLEQQYSQIIENPAPAAPAGVQQPVNRPDGQPGQAEPQVIKLFDDE